MGEHNCYKKNEEECIKRKAYELWEKDGCEHGRAKGSAGGEGMVKNRPGR